MEPWYILVLYFAICAFLGVIIWSLLEKISIVRKEKLFLYGPFSVIDGTGVLAIYFYSLLNLPLIVKIVSYFLILVMIEYLSSIFLEKALRLKLWDHTKYKFNLHGRVSLRVSLLWFALMLFVVFIGQPFLLGILHKLPFNLAIVFSILFLVYFAIDLSLSMRKYILRKRLKKRKI